MSRKHISIIFCGGCNPKINRGQIAERIRGRLIKLGYEVSYNAADSDLFICLSGCSASCAARNSFSAPLTIVVAGSTIDSISVEVQALVAEILNKARAHFEKTCTGF